MLTTGELINVLVRMKVRLAFGKQVGFQAVANALLFALGIAATAGGIALVVWMERALDRTTQLMLLLTTISLAWMILSVIAGSGENILDPGRFAIYPLSVGQLIMAFFVAAFVGVAAPGTLIIAISTLVYAFDALSAGLMLVGALLFVSTAVLSGRLGIAAMSSLVRGRRTREVAGFIAAILAMTAGIVPQILFEFSDLLTEDRRNIARSILRWVPWGWAPESMALAAEGRPVRSVLILLLAAGLVSVLGLSWRHLMTKILTTRPAASEATSISGGLVPRSIRPFGRSATVASLARTLRQLRRDPREFLEVVSFMPLVIISALPALDAVRDREPSVVLSVAAVGIALGITSLNMFGADGRSFGVDALASGNMRPIVMGKALARAVLAAPLIVLIGFALAAFTNGWQFLLASYLIASTALLAMLAVGMVFSVRYPFPLVEKVTVGGGAGGTAGCGVALIRLFGMLIGFLLAGIGSAPVVAASLLISPLVGTLVGFAALAYGAALFWFGGKWAGEQATARVPELFQTLSTAL